MNLSMSAFRLMINLSITLIDSFMAAILISQNSWSEVEGLGLELGSLDGCPINSSVGVSIILVA